MGQFASVGVPGSDVVGVSAFDDSPVVHENDRVEETFDLLDQMRGQNEGARVLCVVREEARVKDFPGDGVHSEVDLVEYGHRTSGGQAQQCVEA